jgi:hypothetical protein
MLLLVMMMVQVFLISLFLLCTPINVLCVVEVRARQEKL